MDKREFVVILSNLNIGSTSPTVCYRKEIYETYLIELLDIMIDYANYIEELILLGDIFEFWSYPPIELPPTFDDIIATHPNLLGPSGKLSRVLSALKGRVVFIPGNTDMNITAIDLKKLKNTDGYEIKYHAGAYIPSFDTGLLLTHGNEFCLLNTPYDKRFLSPLPFNYFLSRAFSYRIARELHKRQIDSIIPLTKSFVPGMMNLMKTYLEFYKISPETPHLIKYLIDAMVYATNIPRNQSFQIDEHTVIAMDELIKRFDGLGELLVKSSNRQVNEYVNKNGIDRLIMGHTPIMPSRNSKLEYSSTSSRSITIPGLLNNSIQYGVYRCSRRTMKLFPTADHFRNDIKAFVAENKMVEVHNISDKKQLTFGWSVYNESWEFFEKMQKGVLAKAKELGIKVISHDQKSNSIEMVIGCLQLINKHVDALIISPYNPNEVPYIVANAKTKDIPVVIIDGGTGGADVLAFIVSDSFAGGILAAEYALSLIKKYSIESKNVAIIQAEMTATYALRRGKGFKSVMVEHGYEVVSEVSAEGELLLAYEEMTHILNSYQDDLAVVFCENGNMTLGAAKAIEEANKTGKIMLIGFDLEPDILEAIKEGTVQGTVAQQPIKMGEIGVEVAYLALQNKPIVYDDWTTKEILMEVYLIDESGEASSNLR